MKSIALIYTKSKESFGQGGGIIRPGFPQGIFYLGSYLKKRGVKVYIIHGELSDAKSELDKIISKVDVIGFSVVTMQVSNSLELSRYIKSKYPEKEIVWGGIHPSLLSKQTIESDLIDYVCQREGEDCLYELCKGVPLKKIKNLVYKKNGKVIINPLRDFIDLNKEEPVWDLLNLEDYIGEHNFEKKKVARSFVLSVGRGCIFNCAFCVNPILGKKWRGLAAKEIIKRIKFLKENYQIQHFSLCDDCFDADLKRVEEFCKLLLKEKLNITWDVSVRAGNKWTDERMELCSKSGCLAFSVGAESGSDRILRMINKGNTTEAIVFIANQCRKYDISLISSWMSGFPTETEEDLQKTIQLLKKVYHICPSGSIIGPQPFKPYPNSELYFEAVKQGFKEPKSLEEWAIKSNEGFISESQLPWVKNPRRLRLIEFYCMNATRKPRNFFHWVLTRLSWFRINHNLYVFPFEVFLTKFYVTKIYRKK